MSKARNNVEHLRIVTPSDYQAVGDGVADDTIPLNNFHAAVSAGKTGRYGDKVYAFTAALTAITGTNVNLTGKGAVLLYTGASATPGNLMTFSSASLNSCQVEGFTIASTTVLTAGYAMRVTGFQHATIDVKFDGDELYGGKLYRGLFVDGSSVVNLRRSRFFGCAVGVSAVNVIELYFNNAFIKGRSTAAVTNGIGVLIGGGCGGIYFQGCAQLLNNIGLQIDQSLGATANQQLFFGWSTWDTNYTNTVLVNDASVNAIGKILDLQNAWFASCVTGNGFDVTSWGLNSKVKNPGATFINNFGDGIKFSDAGVKYLESIGCVNANNGGYGVNATAAMEIYSDATPYSNTSGAYNKLITRRTAATIQRTLTVANASNAALPRYSGQVTVVNPSNGTVGAYLAGGGLVSLMGTTSASAWVAPTTSPAALAASVQWDAVADYRVYNNFGSSQDFLVTITVVRETV
jgi:hypothetical protein